MSRVERYNREAEQVGQTATGIGVRQQLITGAVNMYVNCVGTNFHDIQLEHQRLMSLIEDVPASTA